MWPQAADDMEKLFTVSANPFDSIEWPAKYSSIKQHLVLDEMGSKTYHNHSGSNLFTLNTNIYIYIYTIEIYKYYKMSFFLHYEWALACYLISMSSIYALIIKSVHWQGFSNFACVKKKQQNLKKAEYEGIIWLFMLLSVNMIGAEIAYVARRWK